MVTPSEVSAVTSFASLLSSTETSSGRWRGMAHGRTNPEPGQCSSPPLGNMPPGCHLHQELEQRESVLQAGFRNQEAWVILVHWANINR